MTTRAISKDNQWELVVSLNAMRKVATFMKQSENCPTSIIEDIMENNCPMTNNQVHSFVNLDLCKSSIFDGDDIPPPQAIVTNISSATTFQNCNEHKACGTYLSIGGLVFVNGVDVRYTKEGVYYIGVYKLSRGKKITCKVGYVRVCWNKVKYFTNCIACIEKIVHQPKLANQGRGVKDSLQAKHHGYCIINFLDTWGALLTAKDANRAGKEICPNEGDDNEGGKEHSQKK